jgi:hypothetical protein
MRGGEFMKFRPGAGDEREGTSRTGGKLQAARIRHGQPRAIHDDGGNGGGAKAEIRSPHTVFATGWINQQTPLSMDG